MRNRVSKNFLLLSLSLLLVACAHSAPQATSTSPGSDVRFADVQPILEDACTGCHAGAEAEAGLRLDTWQGVVAGSDYGEAVIPFDAAHSRLVQMAAHLEGGPHPAELMAAPLEDEDVELIRRWIDEGAKNDEGVVPHADAQNLLYVADQGDAMISIIDMDANQVVRTVDLQALGFSANAKPHHTAVEPDGSAWYVSLIGENKVLKFDRDSELIGQADFEVPGMLSLDPTSDRLYVARSMSAVNPPRRIGIIDRSDMTIDELDVFFPRPHALSVDPKSDFVYVASLAENQIASIDEATEDVELEMLGGTTQTLVQFAVSPDGQTMIAGGQMTGQMLVFDLTTPSNPTVVDTIAVGAQPWHPVFTPDGRYVYVGNKEANTVTAIDMDAREVAAVIEGEGIAQPHGSAVSPDGRYVYISNNNLKGAYTPRHAFGDESPVGTVVVIDTSTNTIAKVIEVGHYPAGINTRSIE